jgi:dTDP-4-amino-4,6-dideoxygalactose transaminase
VSSPNLYNIPIVDLQAQYSKLRGEIRAAIEAVLETQQFILGPAVKTFEDQMAAFLQCGFAAGVASGSDALLLALMALDIGPGDGVIVSPLTFFSTVSSLTRLGATPLFVDIEAASYLLSAAAVEWFLSEHGRIQGEVTTNSTTGLRVKALLPVHLFGQCCDMAAFIEIAKKYRLHIIEDVAQACGARTLINAQVKFAGTVGDLGCFSFFPTKTLGGFGDGGLIATNQEELAEKVKMLRMHGERAKYHHEVTGINSRLDSIQAAVLSVKHRYLKEWCEQRVQRAQTYDQLFLNTGLVKNRVICIPAVPDDGTHVFNNYVVRVQGRDELKQFLADQGIQTEIYYPMPLHLQACFAGLGYSKGDFPRAELAATEVLALPMYPELTAKQQELIVEKIRAFYRR